MNVVKPIKSVDDLVKAGLVAPTDRVALEEVAARYAIALTPAISRLIDRADPMIRSHGNSCLMRQNS
jgi:lysine 2,3-aminomutase